MKLQGDSGIITVPSAYIDGYPTGRRYDRALADNYIRHTTVGDPPLDPVMEELAGLPPQDLHRFIKAGIDEEEEVMRSAPSALRDFFDNLEDPPWFEYESFRPGMRAFHIEHDKHPGRICNGRADRGVRDHDRQVLRHHRTGVEPFDG